MKKIEEVEEGEDRVSLEEAEMFAKLINEYVKERRGDSFKKVKVLGYEARYLINAVESDGSGTDESFWVVQTHTLEATLLKRRDNVWLAVPTGLETIISKYPYEYDTAVDGEQTNKWVQEKTSKIGSYNLLEDPFVSKFIPAGHTQIQSGGPIIRELYNIAVGSGIIPKNSQLFEDIVQNKLFSYIKHNYQGSNNDGSTHTALYFKAFVPRKDGEEEIPAGLLPGPSEREYKKLLKETKELLEKLRTTSDLEEEEMKRASKRLGDNNNISYKTELWP